MSATLSVPATVSSTQKSSTSGKLVLGTGLAFASLILVPALAAQFGLGASLTGALRIALMKASSRAITGSRSGADEVAAPVSCH